MENKFDPNSATEISDELVAFFFDYHEWTPEQVAADKKVREALGAAYKAVIENVPPGPTRNVALRKIREAWRDASSQITDRGMY